MFGVHAVVRLLVRSVGSSASRASQAAPSERGADAAQTRRKHGANAAQAADVARAELEGDEGLEDVFHRGELIASCQILTPAESSLRVAATPSRCEPVKGTAPLWTGRHGKNAPPEGCKVRGLASLNLFDELLKFI